MLAVQKLKARDRRVQVVSHGVVGDGNLRRGLARLIGQLDIGDSFSLGGYLPDPAPRLRDCRAVAVTSVSHSGGPETFCRAIIEAWAHRKPVVAYAVGAPARLISHEEDGLLVPEGDIDALAAAIWRLQSSPDLCRRLGEAGHAKAAEHYEAGLVTRRLLAELGLATA
jgi:glycosyltransferase involved in cell wall biosynthesis